MRFFGPAKLYAGIVYRAALAVLSRKEAVSASWRACDSDKPYAGATFAFCRRGPTACSACIKRADEPLQLHVFTYKRFARADLFETVCFCFLNQ